MIHPPRRFFPRRFSNSLTTRGKRSPLYVILFTLACLLAPEACRKNVVAVRPVQPKSPEPARSPSVVPELFDVFFDHDKATLDGNAIAALENNVDLLNKILGEFPDSIIDI
jgi:hypothetical protein